MSKVCHAPTVPVLCSSAHLVQKSSKLISLSEILSSLSPASLSECLAVLRRDINTHFIGFVLTQPLSITQVQNTDTCCTLIEHRLELFPAPPNSAALASRLDNLSEILVFLDTHLFGAVPSPQRAAFLKSFSKPLTSGILNHLLVPALPTSLSGLPKYLELLERAVKFEDEVLTRILFGPASGISTGTEFHHESEIKSWVEGIVSHYQKKRRMDILDQARGMFTAVSSDWHETFQVEWTTAPAATGVNGPTLPELDPAFGPPPASIANGANGASKEVEIEQIDDDGWGFNGDDDRTGEDTLPDEEVKGSRGENGSPPFTDQDAHTAEEVDDDAWGWNDEEDPEPTPMLKLEVPKGNGNGNAGRGASGDDPLWDAWDDAPPSPPTKKVVPRPATNLEKFSNKGKQGAKPPKIVTQPPEPGLHPVPVNTSTHVNPDHFPGPDAPTSLSRSWSSTVSTPSQQFQSIPPTPASVTVQPKSPKEFYSVSSGMQDILELVESVMLESCEFSRSTLLAAYLPAPNSASSNSSTSGDKPGSVILNTVPSILDLFRALYPMTLRLDLEGGNDFHKGARKGVTTEGIMKKALQFSNDCLYLEERIRELVPVSSPKPINTPTIIPSDVWTIDPGLGAKVKDAGKRVKVYGDSWYTKTIVRPLFPLYVSYGL